MNKSLIVKINGPKSNVKTDGSSPNTICVGNKTQELKQPQKNGVV